jgi:hypothetical protein
MKINIDMHRTSKILMLLPWHNHARSLTLDEYNARLKYSYPSASIDVNLDLPWHYVFTFTDEDQYTDFCLKYL